MIETLYKTNTPVKERSECYVLVLTARAASGRKVYAFMEEHGRWDETQGRFVYEVKSIGTDEALRYEQALEMYNQARRALVQQGFIHSFLPDCHKGPHEYRVFEPEVATA